MRHIPELGNPFKVSDALFVAARDGSGIPVLEISTPFWIESTRATNFAPRMPRLLVRYAPQSWSLAFLAALFGQGPLVVNLTDEVPDLNRRADFINMVPDVLNIDQLVTGDPRPIIEIVAGRAIMQYKAPSRDDRLGTAAITFDGQDATLHFVEQTFEFDRIQGGDVTVVASIMIMVLGGFLPLTVTKVKARIRGKNPSSKRAIREFISRHPRVIGDYHWLLWVIAWVESRFRQFDDRSGLPLSFDGIAIGMMGLRWWGKEGAVERPGPQECWDWQANVRKGISVFYDYKKAEVDAHYEKKFKDTPAALAQFRLRFPDQSAQFKNFYRPAYYQRYKGGYYWIWEAGRWIPDPKYRVHGDFLLAVEERARQGALPEGWD